MSTFEKGAWGRLAVKLGCAWWAEFFQEFYCPGQRMLSEDDFRETESTGP